MYKKLLFSCLLYSFFINSWNPHYYTNDAHESLRQYYASGNALPGTFVDADYIKYYPYYKKYVEKCDFVDVAQINIKKLPYPYSALKRILPFDPFGVFFNEEFINKIFKNNTIVNAIEIGSHLGLSTRHIARLLPEHGKLYAIDIWTMYGPFYEPFLSNIVHCGLENKVVPIQAYSTQAIYLIRLLNMKFDLIYVDGDHTKKGVLNDLELYYPMLSSTGVMAGDDWLVVEVRQAVIEFAQKYNLSVYADCNFFFLKEEGRFQIKSLLNATDEDYYFGNK